MRASGILMPISSLPSAHGIGAMGAEARRFVEFLSKAGQAYWQILPICPTSYGDSPYQSFSTFAGNPYFIDLDELAKRGLLLPEEYENIDWKSGKQRQTDQNVSSKKYHNAKHYRIILCFHIRICFTDMHQDYKQC